VWAVGCLVAASPALAGEFIVDPKGAAAGDGNPGTADKPLPMGHWLQLRLSQPGGNRDAIGAWVEVDLGGRILRQELTVGGGHASGHLGWMHFGLGEAREAKLRVQWPHGPWSPWMPLHADAFYRVDREAGSSPWKAP